MSSIFKSSTRSGSGQTCSECSLSAVKPFGQEKVDIKAASIATITFFCFRLSLWDNKWRHVGIKVKVTRDDGSTETFVHEVGAGHATSHANYLRPYNSNDEKIEARAEVREIAAVNFHSKSSRAAIPKLFDYTSPFHLVTNNCRDHALHFIDKLRKEGYRVTEDAESFVQNVKKVDLAMVLGGVVTAVAVVAAVVVALPIAIIAAAASSGHEDDGADDD